MANPYDVNNPPGNENIAPRPGPDDPILLQYEAEQARRREAAARQLLQAHARHTDLVDAGAVGPYPGAGAGNMPADAPVRQYSPEEVRKAMQDMDLATSGDFVHRFDKGVAEVDKAVKPFFDLVAPYMVNKADKSTSDALKLAAKVKLEQSKRDKRSGALKDPPMVTGGGRDITAKVPKYLTTIQSTRTTAPKENKQLYVNLKTLRDDQLKVAKARSKWTNLQMRNHLGNEKKFTEAALKDRQAQTDRVNARYERLNKEWSKLKPVDPNKWWSDQSVPQSIMTVLAATLGGALSGLKGGPNQAMQVINKAIDRDIHAQMANLKTKKEGLSRKGANFDRITQLEGAELEEALKLKRLGMVNDLAIQMIISGQHPRLKQFGEQMAVIAGQREDLLLREKLRRDSFERRSITSIRRPNPAAMGGRVKMSASERKWNKALSKSLGTMGMVKGWQQDWLNSGITERLAHRFTPQFFADFAVPEYSATVASKKKLSIGMAAALNQGRPSTPDQEAVEQSFAGDESDLGGILKQRNMWRHYAADMRGQMQFARHPEIRAKARLLLRIAEHEQTNMEQLARAAGAR